MTQFCDLEVTPLLSGRVLLKCKVCTFVREWSHPKLVRRCGVQTPSPKLRDPCKHRGNVVSLQECASCGGKGKTRVKVFECPLHIICTISKKLPEIASCQICEDWVPISPEKEALPILPSQ